MDQLSPQDAQFLYMPTGNNLTHVTSVSVYDPSTVPSGRTGLCREPFPIPANGNRQAQLSCSG